MVVSHLDKIPHNGRSHSKRAINRVQFKAFFAFKKIESHRIAQAFKIFAWQDFNAFNLSWGDFQAKACVRAANIG